MKGIRWNLLKSSRLKATRGVSFEEMLQARLISVMSHHQKKHQSIMLFEYRKYVWVVPYVETQDEIFLKTLYPSRKYTHMHKRGELL